MSQGTIKAQGFHSSGRGRLAAATAALLICTLAGWSAADAKSAKVVDFDKTLKGGYNDLSIGNVDEAIATFEGKCKKYPERVQSNHTNGVLHVHPLPPLDRQSRRRL